MMRIKWDVPSLNKTDLIFIITSFFFCLIVAVSLSVNPFPDDGWFRSQYQLFGQEVGGDNYTPIAAPALLYAAIHGLALIFGLNLAQELYLGSLVHTLMLFVSGIFIYLSTKLLKIEKLGSVCALITVIYIGSTFVTHSFWSENITIFLTAAILFNIVTIYTNPQLSFQQFSILMISFAILLGLLASTRVIPILILPGTIVLFFFKLSKKRALLLSGLTSLFIIALVVIIMTTNYYRFGRFELTNSAGRHLWNAVSPTADILLAESPDYQIIKKYIPKTQGKPWWEIDPQEIPELNHLSREDLLWQLSVDAISNHPLLFLKSRINRTRFLLDVPPGTFGLSGKPNKYNPLNRQTFLPPIIPSFSAFNALLRFIYETISKFYSLFIFLPVYISVIMVYNLLANPCLKSISLKNNTSNFFSLAMYQLLLLFVGQFVKLSQTALLFLTSLLIYFQLLKSQLQSNSLQDITSLPAEKNNLTALLLFLSMVFLACLLSSCLIEEPVSRIVTSYFPFLSLMVAVSIKIIETELEYST